MGFNLQFKYFIAISFLTTAILLAEQPSIFINFTNKSFTRKVEALKQNKGFINEKEKSEILKVIKDIGIDSFISKDGKRLRKFKIAIFQLKERGRRSLPLLVSSTENTNSIIRARVLGLIFDISKKADLLNDFSPVFIRSLKDVNPNVRKSAISQIGNCCVNFKINNDKKNLKIFIDLLIVALGDKNIDVQRNAAENLLRIGKKELVSKDKIKQLEIVEDETQ